MGLGSPLLLEEFAKQFMRERLADAERARLAAAAPRQASLGARLALAHRILFRAPAETLRTIGALLAGDHRPAGVPR